MTKQCLESIYTHTDHNKIEVIVVDNGSSDGTVDYIKEQKEITAVFNEKNLGFAKGCNQGVKMATGERFLFLNNDTVVTKNWLDRMLDVLEHSDKIGMVGPVSNYVSGHQKVDVLYESLTELDAFANTYCEKKRGKTRQVLRLVGFCLLVKREVLDVIGVFDEQFEYGSFEDDDLCLRALQHGYQLHIVEDSFVHHHGHATFTGNKEINMNELYWKNRQRFIEKWQVDLTYFMHPRPEIVQMVPAEAVRILDVGCGAGASGLELINRQSCQLYGIELHPLAAAIARANYKQVLEEDVELLELPWPESYFDVILFADILEHLKDPWKVIQSYATVLKKGGSVICSIPNIMHAEALFPLLQGEWNYRHAGILDRTHLRFFTPQTIHTLFPPSMFEIQTYSENEIAVDPKVSLFFREISQLAEKFQFPMKQLSDQISKYQMLIHVIKT
nr:glycosyltransferase [Bacillus sp. FJAT-50079]